MAVHIARGEESSFVHPVLDLWLVRPGTGELVEAPWAVAYRIVELSTGVPVEALGWSAVDSASPVQPGRYAASWTPGAVPDPAPKNGRHRIDWRVQLDELGPVRVISETFDVLNAEVAFPYPEGYALVSDLRAEGVTGSDYALQEALAQASRDVERITGRRFTPTWHDELPVVGEGLRSLRFDDPVIALAGLWRRIGAGSSAEPIETERYVVFNRHVTHGLLSPDDRADPRVELGHYGGYPLGVGQSGRAVYRDVSEAFGDPQLYLATGLFGYTDPDGRSFAGVTPRGIVEATKRLAVAGLVQLGGASGAVVGSGSGSSVVKSESTRDQSVTYETGGSLTTKVGQGAIGELTGDAVTDQLLARYVRPRVWAL